MKKLLILASFCLFACEAPQTDTPTTQILSPTPAPAPSPAAPTPAVVPVTPEPSAEDTTFKCPVNTGSMPNLVIERDRDVLFYSYDGDPDNPQYTGKKVFWDRIRGTYQITDENDEITACGIIGNWTKTNTFYNDCEGTYSFTLDYNTPTESKQLTCTMYYFDLKKVCDEAIIPYYLKNHENDFFITCPSSYEYDIDWWWRTYND